MFFKNNQNLLIGAGVVSLLWLILYYVLVSDNWADAAAKREEAAKKRKKWETLAHGDADREKVAKDKHPNPFKSRPEAEKDLNAASEQIELKFKEMRRIEFGTRDSLKAFSIAAAGQKGDTRNLLNEKIKQTRIRANTILKSKKIEDNDLSAKFRDESSSDALNLLRLALVDRFLTACKDVKDPSTNDCKIEELAGVDYYEPKVILAPEDDKVKDAEKDKDTSDEDPAEAKKNKAKGKDKDKEKSEKGEKREGIDRLVQIPMKVVVRGAERYINQLLYELGKPTPAAQDAEDKRGYFCVKGFHLAVSNSKGSSGEHLVEMSVAVSALLRESEVKALGIALKADAASRRDPF